MLAEHALLPAQDAASPEPPCHSLHGMTLLASGQAAQARSVLQLAIADGDDSATTSMNLALAEAGMGNTDRALARMRSIQQRLPDWDEPMLRQAETLRACGRRQEAEQAYEATLAINPTRVEALLGLAVLKLQRRDGLGAQPLLLRCCGVDPGHPQAWDALGFSLLLTGDHAAAEAAFAEAQGLAPGVLDYALHRVNASLAADTAAAELVRLKQASFSNPLDPVLPTAMGMLLERLGRRDEAICALQIATTLAPDAPRPAAILGELLARSHRGREAERALAHAITLDPGNSQLRNDHAAVLMRLHRHSEAKATLEAILASDGPDVTALCNLANVTVSLGQQAAAIAIAREAIALAPGEHLPWRALCNSLPYHAGASGAEMLDALGQCAALLPRPQDAGFANTQEPDRRLRIGLLSGSLRTHPVGWLTIAGLETLDPQAFELICLGHDAAPDPMALRFAAIASAWHATDGLDDAALCQLTRSLGIDILIDLGGYGDTGRLPACARRLAPCRSNGSACRTTAPVCRKWTGSLPIAGKRPRNWRICTPSDCSPWKMVTSATARRLMHPMSVAFPPKPTDTSPSAASTTWPRSPHRSSPPGLPSCIVYRMPGWC